MSKSKQLLDFRNTIYLTEWFQQQTEFTLMYKCLLKFYFSGGKTGVITRKKSFFRASGFRSPSEIAALQQKNFDLRCMSIIT